MIVVVVINVLALGSSLNITFIWLREKKKKLRVRMCVCRYVMLSTQAGSSIECKKGSAEVVKRKRLNVPFTLRIEWKGTQTGDELGKEEGWVRLEGITRRRRWYICGVN